MNCTLKWPFLFKGAFYFGKEGISQQERIYTYVKLRGFQSTWYVMKICSIFHFYTTLGMYHDRWNLWHTSKITLGVRMMHLRKATLADKEQVLEICKTVWEGHDYIPNIFDQWVSDPEGEFTLIMEEDVLTGLAKFTMSQPGIGWLEGLRVAPEARSRGYAKVITGYYIEKGRQMGLERLQLSTYFENHPSIHVSESYGFQRVAEFCIAEKTVDPNQLPQVSLPVVQLSAESPDCEKVVEFLLASPEQQAQRGFLGYGWLFRSLNEEEVRAAIARGHVYYLTKAGQVDAATLIYPDPCKDQVYNIVMVTGSDEGIELLLDWACIDAVERGFSMVSAMVPEYEHLKAIYLAKGYQNWDDNPEPNAYIYELPLKEGETA